MNNYKNLFQLNNKVAVVTGAAGILGSEFCKALSEFGAKVVCLDSDVENLKKLKNNLTATGLTRKGEMRDADERATGVDALVDRDCERIRNEVDRFSRKSSLNKNHDFLFLPCDVSNSDSVQKTIDQVIREFSQIDILLNNAATKTKKICDFFAPFSSYSLDVWREVMSVNLDGMFLMAQAVGKHMIKRKSGSIVQMASLYSLIGPDQRIYEGSRYLNEEINTPAVYTASKAGVIGLTKHLATLWGSYNIRVNALCPGGVSSGQNTVFQEKYSARVPMGRMADAIDIVGPLLFLADDASQYVTGQVLYADGGVSAW